MKDNSDNISSLSKLGFSNDEIQLLTDAENNKIDDSKEEELHAALRKIHSILGTLTIKHNEETEKSTMLGFIPGVNPITKFATSAAADALGYAGTSPIELMDEGMAALGRAGSSAINAKTGITIPNDVLTKTMTTLLRGVADDVITKGFTGAGGGNSDGGTTNPYSPGAMAAGTGFTFIPKPMEIRFTPNVPNTVYGEVTVAPNDELSSTTDQNIRARMHMNCIDLSLPSFGFGLTDAQVNPVSRTVTTWFRTVFTPNLQTRAQASVAFNINAQTHFTAEKLHTYVNTVLKALSIYYFYAHTYAYTAISTNKNTAMYELREIFSTSDLQNLRLLEERLNGMPIPPKLNELCYWMFDIYRSSSVAGSDLIRLAPFGIKGADAGATVATQIIDGSTLIKTQLNALSDLNPDGTSNGRKVLTTGDFLARVCPDWVNVKVGSSAGIPLHDPAFTTLFWNQQVSFGVATEVPIIKPVYVDNNTDTAYNSYCEEVDGVIQSMFSWYSAASTSKFNVGWVKAIPCDVGGQWTNRFTYGNGNAGFGFYSYTYTPNIWAMRNDTYRPGGSTGTQLANIIGTNRCEAVPVLGMNVNSVQQASVSALDYLLGIGQVGSKAALASDVDDEKPLKGQRRGRKRK
jgi:hypothetical protein